MTVYVDDMYKDPLGRYGRMRMSHMIADTDEELHEMAARIGVAEQWWQSPQKTSGSHYDIAMSKRTLAVQYGAIEITMYQCAAMNARRRVTGSLGRPEDAEQWFHEYRAARKKEVS